MPSQFVKNDLGEDLIDVDPHSDQDYSITSWMEGLIFTAIDWEVAPTGPVLYNSQINAAPLTIGGVVYAIGKVASIWIKTLEAGKEYRVTLKATFTGNRKDDKSFILKCRQH